MTEIIFQGKGEPAIPIPAGEVWTIKYAAYDAFGLIGLVESPAVDVDSLEVLVDVPPGSIEFAQFAAGLSPVEIVDVLPNPTGYAGPSVVLLTTDGQLYRYVSGAWTALIPAASVGNGLTAAQIASVNAAAVAGTLTADQIASINAAQIVGSIVASQIASINAAAITGTVTAAQIASVNAVAIAGTITGTQIGTDTITSVNIAASAITSSEIAAGAVVAGRIAANAVTAGTIAANAVQAGNIAANAVTAGTIAAGAVTATAIAANTITAAQIAAGTITATQIAANTITAANLVANTITAGQIAAGTITATQIAADTITSGNIAANAITSSELAANSVIAGKIQAGAVSATEIAAGAIVTEKLGVGTNGNTIGNSDFRVGIDGWTASAASGNTGVMSLRAAGSSWTLASQPVLQVYQADAGTAGYVDVRWRPRRDAAGNTSFSLKVQPGDKVGATARVSAHRCICDLRIEYRDAAGALLSYSGNNSVNSVVGSSTEPDQWTLLSVIHTAPANAVWAEIHIRKNATLSGQPDSYMMVYKPFLTKLPVNATQVPEYGSGGYTVIDGTSIVTGSIQSDQIAANAITAAKIAAGTITADKLLVGTLSAISANLGAITGGSININNKFIVDSAGNVTLQSSASGQRLVLTNSRLEVYDASNVLRVRLGIW